jgi:hypothetical protein
VGAELTIRSGDLRYCRQLPTGMIVGRGGTTAALGASAEVAQCRLTQPARAAANWIAWKFGLDNVLVRALVTIFGSGALSVKAVAVPRFTCAAERGNDG